MKKKLQSILLVMAMFAWQDIFSQTFVGADASKRINGAERIVLKPQSNLPAFLEFSPGRGPSMKDLSTWLQKNLSISPDYNFILLRTEKDKLGFEHSRLQQTYKGIPVHQSMLIVHAKNGLVSSFNGDYVSNIKPKSWKQMPEKEALTKATRFVGAQSYKWENPEEEAFIKKEQNNKNASFYPEGKLLYVKSKTGAYVLSYQFDIYAQKPFSRKYVYVNVETGEIVNSENRIHHTDVPGTAHTAYSGLKPITTEFTGSEYRLRESGRGQGIQTFDMRLASTNYGDAVDFIDDDNNWDNVNSNLDQYATDAHIGAELTYDYFLQKHGRNSIDNSGFQLNNYVHVQLTDFGYGDNVNAFWDGSRMSYGDGGFGYTPLTSLDIAGHEITHGLTEFSAGLNYSYESGALNEGFSDIFGTTIEFFGKSEGEGNWYIGEQIGGAFRNMANPNDFGQPDTYLGSYWFTGSEDNGGVHYNSGVLNHWFYLLSQGGSGTNDIGNAYSVSGIGMSKAAEIAYRTLTVYLTPNSQYADARYYAIQASTDLFGPCSAETNAVKNAWYAVGVNGNLTAPVITAIGPLTFCPGGSVVLNAASPEASGFQWKKGGVSIAGATSPSYTASSAGSYTVTATYCNNSKITSDSTVVSVPAATAAISPSGSIPVCAGSSLLLTANISSGYAIQWKRNGIPIEGANESTYLANTGGNYTVTISATSVQGGTFAQTIPAEIPDASCTGVASEISVNGLNPSYPSSNISVKLNITHTWVSDVVIFLEAPTGEKLCLSYLEGGSGDNFTNTIFSDNGLGYLSSGLPPFTGVFKPEPYIFTICDFNITNSTFASLGGGTINPNGTWKLWALDLYNGDYGPIENWEIIFPDFTVPTLNCGPATSAATTNINELNLGTMASGNQTLTSPADPAPVNFAVLPSGSGSFLYQWYFQDGIVEAPTGSETSGWTSIIGANSSSYNPETGVSGDRSYACFVTPAGTPTCGSGAWASGVRQITVTLTGFNPGILSNGNETLCKPADPASIGFSLLPFGSPIFKYQWYYQNGIVPAPFGSTTGWTLIGGATSSSYNPPAGLASSRTYACRLTPTVGLVSWASGAKQVIVLPSFTRGNLASGNQTLLSPVDPSNILLSSLPKGSDNFSFQWFYTDGIVAAPSGSSTVGWTLISGANLNSYDPPAGLTNSRSYACFVTPGGSPTCGTAGWATGVRQIKVTINRGTIASGNQTICNGGDPSNIAFSIVPSGSPSFTYAWYYKAGLVGAPSGSSTAGWTNTGINTPDFDPSAGLVASRTYACFVTPSSGTAAWAKGARQVKVLPVFSLGTISSGLQTITIPGNPGKITFTSAPKGSESFSYRWYYQDGIVAAPTGTDITGWTLLFDTTGSYYDPSPGLLNNRTYACYVFPTGATNCGTEGWAAGVRQIKLIPFVKGTLAAGNKTYCAPADPGNITFSSAPTSGTKFQWYYADGILDAPNDDEPNYYWNYIPGATASSYNPPAGLTYSRSYTCRVKNGENDQWTNGVRQITILPLINPGNLAFRTELFSQSGDPANIVFDSLPSGGEGTFTYQWYYSPGLQSAPVGSDVPAEWIPISGATGPEYNPPVQNASISYAVMVDPTGTLDCGNAVWTNGSRQIRVEEYLIYVTYRVNIGNYLLSNPLDPAGMRIGGNFTTLGSNIPDWTPSAPGCAMSKEGETDIWSITVPYPPSSIGQPQLYKFVNGNWGTNEFYLGECGVDDGYGNFNRQLIIPSENSTVTFCYEGCYPICPLPGFNPGTISYSGDTLCNPGDPSPIFFTDNPSGAASYSFEWFYVDGFGYPYGASTTGWTSTGVTTQDYDPPAGLTNSRTYACLVTPEGGLQQWAYGYKFSDVFPDLSYGSLWANDQTLYSPADPDSIAFGEYPNVGGYLAWYYKNGISEAPSGSDISGWTLIPEAANQYSYNPPYGLTSSRTYACFFTPYYGPSCYTPGWVSGVRQITIVNPITVGPAPSNLCSGSSFDLSFTSSIPLAPGEYLQVEVSSPSGEFGDTAVYVGSGEASPIQCTLPSDLEGGAGYKFRFRSFDNYAISESSSSLRILPPVSYGTLMDNQSGCKGYNPVAIQMASNPAGSGAYKWKWYYWENTTVACPTGTSIPSGAKTSSTDTRFFGTSATGGGIFFDPISAGTKGRTWAVLITPIANGSIPACATPKFANNCHRTLITPCREAFADNFDQGISQEADLKQNVPNPFTSETVISCFVPNETKSAKILVMGMDGKKIADFPLGYAGSHDVVLRKGNIAAGIYMYSLILNDEPVIFKKMIISN